jgi:hypothetical protein
MDESAQTKPAETPLKDAMRTARIEAAERSGVVVELRDAEAARLEILNETLEPLFREIPAEHADIFDRGLSQGSQPRLWIDMVTHVAMGRDKRTYRLLHDTVNGRRVLAESSETEPMKDAITRYIARRLVARAQAMAATEPMTLTDPAPETVGVKQASGASVFFTFLVGVAVGAVALFMLGVYLTR